MKNHRTFWRLFLGNLLGMAAILLLGGLVAYWQIDAGFRGQAANALLWAALAGGSAAIAMSLLVAWMWYSPLRQIAAAAGQIASGDLSRRVPLGGQGEWAKIGQSLDAMRRSLARQFDTIDSQGQDLQTVLATMREGVLATAADGTIVLLNPAAAELLGIEGAAALDRPIQDCVGVLEVVDFHQRLARSEKPQTRQFELITPRGRRTYDLHGKAVTAGRSRIRRVVIVRDITELAAAGSMKAQFVANASHELRTPLATIRAAVDELASADPQRPDDLANLTSILDRQVTRLQSMTNDLLDLHSVESGKLPLKMTDLDLGELAQWARSNFAEQAAAKSVRLDVSATAVHVLRSDRKLLELILRNLLDNAIKFTPAGGRVECVFDPRSDGAVLVQVRDTGCGIGPQDQPRVFERFFQADSARTGDTRIRGTGLGLAIVKHAAERLSGKIDLQSELGRGTTITVTLPPTQQAE